MFALPEEERKIGKVESSNPFGDPLTPTLHLRQSGGAIFSKSSGRTHKNGCHGSTRFAAFLQNVFLFHTIPPSSDDRRSGDEILRLFCEKSGLAVQRQVKKGMVTTMNADFPRILTLLRKERGISQKQAASELGISQALLSHYEKGIRECGLDFVVRTADFYGVSCDYLLGRSPERTGAKLTVEDIPEADSQGRENTMRGSILPVLNKKLLFNALNIVFDMLSNVNDKTLTAEISSFLNLAVYRAFRVLYGVNPKNEQSLFTISPIVARAKATAAMVLCEADAILALNEVKSSSPEVLEKLYISTETLNRDYPMFTSSLLNLIKNSESAINKEVK